jgi:uncharacterized lipoprotein YehR (DUF1307 family)
MKNITTVIFAALLALSLSACKGPSSISGAYHHDGKKESLGFVFDGAGKVSMNIVGQSVSTAYTVDGNKIHFHVPGGGDITLLINPDGSLSDVHNLLGTFKEI